MPAKKEITILKKTTADNIISKLGKNPGRSSRGAPAGQLLSPTSMNPNLIQQRVIVLEEEGPSGDGYYKAKFANRDVAGEKWYPTTDDMVRAFEISGTAGLVAEAEEGEEEPEKAAYLAHAIVANDGGVLWVFSLGGGSSRNWIVITGGENNSYTGDAYDRPGGTVTESGVTVTAQGLVSNAYEPGDASWADKSTDAQGNPVYYIDTFVFNKENVPE